MKHFFDTNIFVYAFLDVPKRETALKALARGGMINVQVLNEFANVARRKHGRSWAQIEAAIAVIRDQFPDIAPLTAQTHVKVLELARDHGFSFYDSLILAAALEADCTVLFSEDLQHGRVIGGLTIQNPFL